MFLYDIPNITVYLLYVHVAYNDQSNALGTHPGIVTFALYFSVQFLLQITYTTITLLTI